jgi:hypothetical protein
MLRKVSTRSKINVSPKKSSTPLKPGDMVRVRSLEEIQATLDEDGRYRGGMLFIDEMAQYCGGTYRVLKRVNKVFDALPWKMKKSHEIVILEGVFCHGYGPYKECDRTCFFFWKEAWLEKIE